MNHRYALPRVTFAAVNGQAGVTLVELMISLTIGLFVVMAATSLLLSTKRGYLMQDDGVQIQASGRYAIEAISRAVRQVAYVNWDSTEETGAVAESMGASIAGLDAQSLKGRTAGISAPVMKSVNGSDVLAIRFAGSGTGKNGDGTMTNCAGFSIAAASQDMTNDRRGWSIFYVAEDATGEPELYCKYQGDSGWSSQAIARGVESFQILYGLDSDMDGLPNRFVTATEVNALDDTLALTGDGGMERVADRNRKTYWKKVVAIKVALLIRGEHANRGRGLETEYDLFGKDHANAFSAEDPGVRIREASLPKSQRGRERQIFSTTIQLRNRPTHSTGPAV